MFYRTSDGIERCPFCGGIGIHENELHVIPILDENGAYIDGETIYCEFTGCEECGIGFYSQDDNEEEGITIRKWNRRAAQPDCESAYHVVKVLCGSRME